VGDDNSIMLLLSLYPNLLAELFGSDTRTTPNTAPRVLTDLSKIGDQRTRAIYEAYHTAVGRDPVEREISRSLADWFNPGAQSEIGRQLGLQVPRNVRDAGWSVPYRQMVEWMSQRLEASAGPEMATRDAEKQQLAEAQLAKDRSGAGVVRALIQHLGVGKAESKGVPTLEREKFEEQKRANQLGTNLSVAGQGLAGLQNLSQMWAKFPEFQRMAVTYRGQQNSAFDDFMQGLQAAQALSSLIGGIAIPKIFGPPTPTTPGGTQLPPTPRSGSPI
jgi:hypothetical protein